ncbi:GntR family transcriptional regulator [Chelativorans sp. YIM 93263]|uniref:GntR family transcriptional regulator n=1 Tax=Chelativorans sp. YIM 93263 TaxID=2906648 RepID=UPI0023782EBA|nr:GntR family transcriptional regulator [Chelativorans sp. YIM 93263]
MTDTAQTEAFGFRPLYRQVKESLVRRLIEGEWQPGQLIPSEMELSRELGVSQGTVRKALDTMRAENLLIRRQGRGTYVAEPEHGDLRFQFFRLVPDDGEHVFPASRTLRRVQAEADQEEAKALGMRQKDPIWRVERIRMLENVPSIIETISLPEGRFPGFDSLDDVPNNLYRIYSQRWGITIGSATEQLKAVGASVRDAKHLDCRSGHPLLRIARTAFDLERNAVELRVSRCLTEDAYYLSELR